MELPAAIDPAEFDARFRLTPEAWRPAVEEICRGHGIAVDGFEPFPVGSNLVAAVGAEHVIKVFPPFHRPQWESERRVLPRFAGAVSVPVPALLHQGERDDGYTYVVIERVAGEGLDLRWPALGPGARASLLEQIGELMAAAHALPVGDLADLPPPWEEFLPASIAGCAARHARLGAPGWVVRGVNAFVPAALEALDLRPPHVLLTGEYTPFNLLVEGPDDAPRLAAMIDLGDAMVGPAAYDLLGPAVFLAGGDAGLLRPLVEGRGLFPWPLDRPTRRGLLALLLTHRYASLDAQLHVPGWRAAGSLEALADLTFCG